MISTIHDGDSPEGRPATEAEIEQVLGGMQTPDGTSFLDLYRECAELDAADGADQQATARPEPREHLSQADEGLRRVIAANPVVLPPLPTDLDDRAAHRRGVQTRGW